MIVCKSDCASCKECCKFGYYELPLSPTVSPVEKQSILQRFPDVAFVPKGECCLMRFNTSGEEPVPCPLLGEKGCLMGEEKPFVCAIFPLVVMRKEEELLIALSPECPVAARKPRELLCEAAKEAAERAFDETRAFPDLAYPYREGFEILAKAPARSRKE